MTITTGFSIRFCIFVDILGANSSTPAMIPFFPEWRQWGNLLSMLVFQIEFLKGCNLFESLDGPANLCIDSYVYTFDICIGLYVNNVEKAITVKTFGWYRSCIRGRCHKRQWRTSLWLQSPRFSCCNRVQHPSFTHSLSVPLIIFVIRLSFHILQSFQIFRFVDETVLMGSTTL